MKDYLQLGIDKGLISFNEDRSRIRYNWQKKERNYNNPEEKVQLLAFLQLILDYNYPESRIRQFEPVTMGSEIKEADIVVFDDELCVKPLILVECKKQEVSEAEFQQAINQAYSYAFALPGEVKYVWVTSGIKNDYLEAMAKQLYDYWFVQFDFPNEEGKPYKSSGGAMVYNERLKRDVPVGWQIENLIDFAEIKNGATPSTTDDANYGGDIVWITPKDLSDQQSKFVYQGERNITKQGFDSCSTSMLPTNSVLMSSRAPIGLVSIAKHEVCTNQGFKSFIPKNIENSIYLYYYIKHHIKQIEQLGTGTTFKEVSRDDLCKFPILVVGANEAYKQWIELQDEIANKQFVLTKEIAALTKQRDELLPLLMNGQASVNYHLSAKVYPLPIAYKKAMPIVANQTISNIFNQKSDSHTPSPCLQTSQIRCS